MKDTLKTLNDIKDKNKTNYKKNCRIAWEDFVYIKDLKAEAVKWVNWEILQDNDFSANGYGDTNNVQSFIKHFFNITEEIRNGK